MELASVPTNRWMVKPQVIYIHYGVLSSPYEGSQFIICSKMGGSEGHYVK